MTTKNKRKLQINLELKKWIFLEAFDHRLTDSDKNFVRENVTNIKHISTLRKQNNKCEKQFESLPNYFLGIFWKKNGFYK